MAVGGVRGVSDKEGVYLETVPIGYRTRLGGYMDACFPVVEMALGNGVTTKKDCDAADIIRAHF